jgi:hypothetical protein
LLDAAHNKNCAAEEFYIAPMNYDFNTTTMASFFCWEKEQGLDAPIASRFLKASGQGRQTPPKLPLPGFGRGRIRPPSLPAAAAAP